MAQRMIRDWTDSEKVNTLSWQAEVLFVRLCMKADDFGSYHANPKLIKSFLFPLRSDSVREADITRWMDELLTAGIIAFYRADDKPYLRITNFGQRLRSMKNRFPDMPSDNSPQLAADCGNPPPEEKGSRRRREGEDEEPPPTPSDILGLVMETDLLSCAKAYFESSTFSRARELLLMNHAVEAKTEVQLKHLAVDFNAHCALEGKVRRSTNEWGKHFKNWLLDPNRKKTSHEQTESYAERRQRSLQQQARESASGRPEAPAGH